MHFGQTNPRWRVFLLGKLRVEVDGEPICIDHWKSKRALKLFKILLAEQGANISRELVVERLWPNRPVEKALRCLHSTMYFLRQELQPYASSPDAPVIHHSAGYYRFYPAGRVWYDVEEFEVLFQKGLAVECTNRAMALQLFLRALELYQGDLLPQERWSESTRRQLFSMYIESIVKAGTLLADENDLESALRLFQLGLKADPLREDLQKAYIRCLIKGERHADAGRHFAGYRTMLEQQFNLQPGFDLDVLMQEARSRSPIDVGDVLGHVPSDPFICDKKTFDAILSLEIRRQKRNGGRLATFRLELMPSTSSHAHKELQSILNRTLQREDVLCWAEESVLLIQVSRTSHAMAERVCRRLQTVLSRATIPYRSINYSVIGDTPSNNNTVSIRSASR